MARGFKIAEGYIEIETRVDGNKIARTVTRAGERAGDQMGRSITRRVTKGAESEANKTGKSFLNRFFRALFIGKTGSGPGSVLFQFVIHPIAALFKSPAMVSALAGLGLPLIGGLTSALSAAVLAALGGGVVALGVAALLGNEKLNEKLQKQNETQVRKENTLRLSALRTQLRARITSMRQAGASEESIRKVREAGEAHIAQVALEGNKKIQVAAKASATSLTDLFTKTGKTILDVLTEAAQPLVGPLKLALENIIELFNGKGAESGLLPILKEMFTQGGKLIPYFVDIFSTFAFRILPAINKIFPSIILVFDRLANRAPEIADALVRLLIAMADPSTIKGFDIMLTFLIKFTDAVAFLIPVLNTLFIQDIRLWEGEIHFLQGAPGRISAAWRNLIGWFKTGFKSFIDFFKAIGRGAMDIAGTIADTFRSWKKSISDAVSGAFRTVSNAVTGAFRAVLDFFQKLPARISRFLVNLPKMLIGLFVLALEGMVYVVAYNLGLIYKFFSELPGRLYRTTSEVIRVLTDTFARAFRGAVGWFEKLPGRLVGLSNLAMNATQRVIDKGLRAVVDFFAKLPGRVVGALGSLGRVLLGVWNSAWGRTFRAVIRIGSDIINWIQRFPVRVFTALVQLAPRLISRFTSAWSSADKTTRSWTGTLIRFVTGLPGRVWSALVRLKDRLVERFVSGWAAATGASKTKVIAMINFVLGIPGRILKALARIPGLLIESGRQLIQGFLVGVQRRISEVGGLGSWFNANMVQPVVRAVKRFFGIKSPSTVFHGIGQNIVAGLWRGIAEHNPTKMIGKIFGGMPQALAKLLEKGLVSIGSLPQRALKALGSLGSSALGFLSKFFGGGGGNKANQALGKAMAAAVGWTGAAWEAFNALIMSESGWNNMAKNPISTAFGIGQFLLGTQRQYGIVGVTDAAKQIAATIRYVFDRYGGPLAAWAFKQAHNWYAKGLPPTMFTRPTMIGVGESGPEMVSVMPVRGGRAYGGGSGALSTNQIAHQGNMIHYNFGPGSIVIEARTIKEFNDVIDLLSKIKPTARAGQRISHQAA